MNIRTKDNKKYITLYIPSFEVFYRVIQRITFEIKNNDFESFKRYNFKSNIVKQRFENFYEKHKEETVSLRTIKYECNSKCTNILSKEFYIDRGWDEKYAMNKISETQRIRSKKSAEKMTDDRQPAQLKYWIKKGLTEKQAKEKLHERQCTFSKEKCIKKYGIEMGLRIFYKRQEKWRNTIYERYTKEEIYNWRNCEFFASKIACELFNPFYEMLKDKYKCYLFNNENNVKEYFIWDKELERFYSYDFTIIELGLIFEYNGEHVHPNPNMSKESWEKWRHHFTKKTADEVMVEYNRKIKLAEQQGFKVVQLWSSDKKENLIKIISSEIQAKEQFLQQQCSQHE